MDEISKLGLAIKAARESKGLSMRQLADAADLSPSTISLLESGQRDASFSTILSISRVLGTTASALLDFAASLDKELANTESWRQQIQADKKELDKLSKKINEKASKLLMF